MKTVDARGQLCPKPVMMVNDAVRDGFEELSVLLDDDVAVSNVTRFLETAGYTVTGSESGGQTVLSALRGPEAQSESRTEAASGNSACLIMSRTLGREDEELGELLMKSFLGALAAQVPLPCSVALMNGGVKLALPDSSCSDTLKELEESGVTILVCGTCTKHFGITDRIVVGRISNMLEIVESVWGVSKPIVLG